MFTFLKKIFSAIWSLLGGMKVTLGEFFQKNITIQYPDQKAIMHERFRGKVHLKIDENTGLSKCTACMLCQRVCPNASIEVVAGKTAEGKRVLRKYIYRLNTCTQCGLCVEACAFDAICFSAEYELAVYDRQLLVMDLNSKKVSLKVENES
jgi:NADH-quinone oxidoreductase subunit I